MPSTYTLISSNVLSASAASVTFSAIPSTYTDLVLRGSTRAATGVGAFDTLYLRFNGLTTTIYSDTTIAANDNVGASYINSAATKIVVRMAEGGATTANTFGQLEIYIPSYTASQSKPISASANSENNATPAYLSSVAGLYRDNATISSLEIGSNNAYNFAAGSSFYLYGIKKN